MSEVLYKGMEFCIGQSQEASVPHPMSIHYLIQPDLILYPRFTLLEEIQPSNIEEIFEILIGISEMAIEGGGIGIGYERIAFRDRWGIVGEKEITWPYTHIYEGGDP